MSYYENLRMQGNKIALIDDKNTEMTYSDLADACLDVGEYFAEKNLVFCFCKNEISAVIVYLSCLQTRNVPLLLNADMDIGLALELIHTYHPKYLFNANEEILNRLECRTTCLSNQYKITELDYSPVSLNENLALLLTTSGSTGSPKLVRQSYTNIQTNAESIAKYLELNEKERPITTLPMNYTYGLSIINSHLLVGSSIVLTKYSLMQKEFWELCKHRKVTSFGGVPYTYEMLKRLKFFNMDLPYLKTMTQAGGKLDPELHKEFAEYAADNGKKFIVMYGQTEATARMAYLPHDKAIEKYGSVGIAIPGGKLWLKDEEGKEIITPDIVGELIYEGANVTLGYAENRFDLKKGDERYGVLETGDVARKDRDGFFYIVGRKKRFLKIFGNRINLDEVEGMLKQKYGISELACGGRDDQMYIFIEPKNEDQKDSIKRYLSEKTKINMSAFFVKIIPLIPQNDSGKIMYQMLEKYYD